MPIDARGNRVSLDPREVGTTLAALRLYQKTRDTAAKLGEIEEIATDYHTLVPLDDDEIDDLCERINFGD